MHNLSLEFYQVFNGFYQLNLSSGETIIAYFNSFTPVSGTNSNIKITQITDLNKFLSSKKSEGFIIIDVPMKNIVSNKKINKP